MIGDLTMKRLKTRLFSCQISSILLKLGFGLSVTALAMLVIFYSRVTTPMTDEIVSQPQEVQTVQPMSLQVVREKGHVRNLTGLDISLLSKDELVLTIHSYIDNTDIQCHRKFRMGNIGDGGWEVCDDPDVRPREPCIIYSFGINNDFSFDDDAARLYGCHVYSFDPSMTREKDQFDRSDKVHFYKIGIAGNTFMGNKNWTLSTLRDIRRKLGHLNTTVDVVKMDVESAEWGAIADMAASGELASVRQFLVEYHVTSVSRDYLLPRLKVIQTVERLGFKKFYVHKNQLCRADLRLPVGRTWCYEVHYMKR